MEQTTKHSNREKYFSFIGGKCIYCAFSGHAHNQWNRRHDKGQMMPMSNTGNADPFQASLKC